MANASSALSPSRTQPTRLPVGRPTFFTPFGKARPSSLATPSKTPTSLLFLVRLLVSRFLSKSQSTLAACSSQPPPLLDARFLKRRLHLPRPCDFCWPAPQSRYLRQVRQHYDFCRPLSGPQPRSSHDEDGWFAKWCRGGGEYSGWLFNEVR